MSVYDKYKLNIDKKKFKGEIIDSFCHVFGAKHRKNFEKRFDAMDITEVFNVKDLRSYWNREANGYVYNDADKAEFKKFEELVIKQKTGEISEIELSKNVSNFNEIEQQFAKLNLMSMDEKDVFRWVWTGGSRTSFNFTEKNGEMEIVPLVGLCPLTIYGGQKGMVAVHEIGHALGLEIVEVNNDEAKVKAGLRYLNVNLKTDQVDMSADFTFIEEAIHQCAITEVMEHLHSKGVYILDDPKSAQTSDPFHKYDRGLDILRPLYKSCKKELLDAGVSHDGFNRLMNIVTEKELLELCKMSKEYADASSAASLFGESLAPQFVQEIMGKSKSIIKGIEERKRQF